jgi:GNAT superfamily N-acetyltransferase
VSGAGDSVADWQIEEWTAEHPRWSELLGCVAALGQESWFNYSSKWQRSNHVLAACLDGQLGGFLRMVVQAIGADDEHEPVKQGDETLLEGKILAFGVRPEFRRRGSGRRLQEAALALADSLGCYQVRSHSGGESAENHQLKLSMGFGVQPILRGEDHGGVYFIMPLALWKRRQGSESR